MKSPQKVFNVKEESIYIFFRDNVVGFEHLPNRTLRNDIGVFGNGARTEGNPNPYYLMKDEISIKKTSGFTNKEILINLRDWSENSRTELNYEYTYRLKEYDDVSNKYELTDFKAVVKEVSRKK